MAQTQSNHASFLEMIKRTLDCMIAQEIEKEMEASRDRILKTIRGKMPIFIAEISKHYTVYEGVGTIKIEIKS